MATIKENLFQSYSFSSEEEEQVAMTFHHLNKAFLQNLRTEYAVEIVNLKAFKSDPENNDDYFIKKAQFQGMVNVLTYLIDLNPSEVFEETTE